MTGCKPPLRCAVLAAASAVLWAGCGNGSDYANQPRPPAPITVTAAIGPQAVKVSPARFGAGPVLLVVANQSRAGQAVTIETDQVAGGGPGLRQTTSPINPRGTAALQVNLVAGRYRLRAGDRSIRPATLRVGDRRRSAQDVLGLP